MDKIEYEFQSAKLMKDIRRVCEAKSLREIEAATGVNASTLSRIDRGHPMDMETFIRLCGECELNPGDYFKRVVWRRVED